MKLTNERLKWIFCSSSLYVVARWYIFKPKIQICVVLEGLAMEDVGIFDGQLVFFTAVRPIMLTFCIYCGNLVYFSHFGML
jgi:hypothetical protein